ncbi:MAG: hypothetical protein IAE91_07835 [Ignavibacteriaceae bacterium]|nr:hypothetical protein [Ignavibacteriaceae bacterium]
MAYFISKYRKYSYNFNGKTLRFTPSGLFSFYTTDSDTEISVLRDSVLCGVDFYESPNALPDNKAFPDLALNMESAQSLSLINDNKNLLQQLEFLNSQTKVVASLGLEGIEIAAKIYDSQGRVKKEAKKEIIQKMDNIISELKKLSEG